MDTIFVLYTPARARPEFAKEGTHTPAKGKKKKAEAAARRPTLVYIHGIGPKPRPAVLKEAWDRALFGLPMGDRTRMAYWADIRHPEAPAGIRARTFGRNAGPDSLLPLDLPDGDAARYAERLAAELGLDRERKRRGVATKVLPIPEPARRAVTRWLTRLLIQDTAAYFYDPDERSQMQRRLRDLLIPGGGPYVVVAHSQGSIIAYDVLSKLTAADKVDVPLLVTIGSPLGIQEMQDHVAKPLRVPTVVAAWKNFADPLDPVALDKRLAGEFKGNLEDTRVRNPDGQRILGFDPHSGEGYLRTEAVREAVAAEVGPRFASRLASFVIARDVAAEMADGDTRHEVLIELRTQGALPLEKVRERVVKALTELVPKSQREEAAIDPLRHYVAAELTTSEIDRLVLRESAVSVLNLWKNSRKRALIERSASAIHVAPARATYRATGEGVAWAVLDTGINPRHPHFRTFGTVAGHFDCTGPGRAPIPQRGLDGDGHGTHVAGIIAGAASAKADEPFQGMAPRAKLYAYKVLDDEGIGKDSWIIKALDHIAELNEGAALVVHGVNLSLGGPFNNDVFGCGHSPLCRSLRRLWQQGVLVCVSAGNEGVVNVVTQEDEEAEPEIQELSFDLSIGDPANLEEAIAVGSVHRDKPHTYGVSYFSSRGPTADGRAKPDVVAPGEKVLSCNVDFATRGEDPYVEMSGTSMACPHVSGLLAGFLSARQEFIGQPDRVKEILRRSCIDLGRDRYLQGAGLPSLMRMLEGV